jgi:3-phosphoshikimate 1-carboxyvinyltransferase
MVAGALAAGTTELLAPLDAADTRVTAEGLRSLGFGVAQESGVWTVEGQGGRVPGGGRLELGDSGTSARFLLALATLGEERSCLDGSPRLRERPIDELADALRSIGGDVRGAALTAGLPAWAGGRRPAGGSVHLVAERSSQFASALLLVAPVLRDGLELNLGPDAVSLPYVDLTAQVLGRFGARIEHPGPRRWHVLPGPLTARRESIEGDHSSASYLLAAAVVVGGAVRVNRLRPDSRQPDARFASIAESLGCRVRRGGDWVEVEGSARLPPFHLHVGEAPDLAPTLGMMALFADGPCVLEGVSHLRLKESDRLQLLADNINRLGRRAEADRDRLIVAAGSGPLSGATILTGGDHRIAMAFAIAGLRIDGVVVDDADCVGKSNPGFWPQLAAIESVDG